MMIKLALDTSNRFISLRLSEVLSQIPLISSLLHITIAGYKVKDQDEYHFDGQVEVSYVITTFHVYHRSLKMHPNWQYAKTSRLFPQLIPHKVSNARRFLH